MSGSYDSGPYIPAFHEQYDLLPRCRRDGREVFSYPCWLNDLDDRLRETGLFDGEESKSERESSSTMLLIPHGCASYAEYQKMLQNCADRCRGFDDELADDIELLGKEIDRLNVKENWSVVRYVGSQFDDSPRVTALTKGRCYYWPCSKEDPSYEGVIDDEEFTSYLYPCDPDSWEILEDPTGMAARALSGEADTVSFWRFDEQEGAPFADFVEQGMLPKVLRGAASIFADGLVWGESERDPVQFSCPGCGEPVDFLAWTKLNKRNDPEAYELLLQDRLSEFVCPVCGYAASLAHPCLLLDPEGDNCIYHVANEQMGSRVEGMFDSLRSDPSFEKTRFRIVKTRQELAEKVRLNEAGLDDRAIEVLKLGISGGVKQQGLVFEGESCEIIFRSLDDGGGLEFGVSIEERRFSTVMDREAYQLFANMLQRSSLASAQPYRVDRAWANSACDVFEAEGL